jgi:hypothetical protein
MKACINCGKPWDCRYCTHCGLNLRLWVKSGIGHAPSELELEEFLAKEYAALEAYKVKSHTELKAMMEAL